MRFEIFHNELHHIRGSRIVQWIHRILHHEEFPQKLREYLLWSFAGIVIASPVPDEFGVALVSSLTNIKARSFAMLCFAFNTAGIIVFLVASKSSV